MKTYDVIMTPSDDGSWVLKSEAVKVIARHKYKRCLAMAVYCHESAMWLEENGVNKSAVFMLRWEKRWMELAEKFKPNNSTAQ